MAVKAFSFNNDTVVLVYLPIVDLFMPFMTAACFTMSTSSLSRMLQGCTFTPSDKAEAHQK